MSLDLGVVVDVDGRCGAGDIFSDADDTGFGNSAVLVLMVVALRFRFFDFGSGAGFSVSLVLDGVFCGGNGAAVVFFSGGSSSDDSLLLCIGEEDDEDTSAAAATRLFLRCLVCFVLFCTCVDCLDGMVIRKRTPFNTSRQACWSGSSTNVASPVY